MLSKFSKKITSFFIRRKSIDETEREIYDYCFEVLLSTALNLVALIIIGVSTAKYLETLVFAIVFMLMRGAGGGIHASTHAGCFFSLMFIFGVMIGLMYLPSFDVLFWVGVGLGAFAFVTSLVLAPVDCANKEIGTAQRKKLKLKLYCTVAFLTTVFVIFSLFEPTKILSFCLAYTAFSVSLLFVGGAIKNAFAKKYRNMPVSTTDMQD